MRLAGKVVFLLLLGILTITTIDLRVSARNTMDLFARDMERDASLVGRITKDLVDHEWRLAGAEGVEELLEDINRQEHLIRLRLVWLDAGGGASHAPQVAPEELEPVLRGETVSMEGPDAAGQDHLFTYVPLELGPRPAALELSQSMAHLRSYARATLIRLLVLTGTFVVLSGILVILVGIFMIGRPLNRLIAKARSIGAGDLGSPMELRGHDELTELADALNTMSEEIAAGQERLRSESEARIAAVEQLRHEDRLKTVGRLASGVAHELGTPLNVVSGRASLIASRKLSREEIVSSAETIRTQAERITAIVRQLLDFARRSTPKTVAVDLRDLLQQAIGLIAPLARRHDISIALHPHDQPCICRVDSGKIQQVMTNLLVNAFQSMPNGGRVNVSLRPTRLVLPASRDGQSRGFFRIDVKDEGQGIRPEDLNHLFEPFFTTKDVGQGTGLGLSISYGIVQEHDGWIDVESSPGVGSLFSVYLPGEGANV